MDLTFPLGRWVFFKIVSGLALLAEISFLFGFLISSWLQVGNLSLLTTILDL